MTREHHGHYSAKHPEGTQIPDALKDAVSQDLRNGQMACKTAFAIIERLNVAPASVGQAIDLLESRIIACQLGLFGYSAEKDRLTKAQEVPPALAQSIQKSLSNNRLSCTDAWRIADAHKFQRIEVARACETLKIKISHCQLGAF